MAALCLRIQQADACADAMCCLQGMRRSCLAGPGCCAWAATSPAAQCCTGALAPAARASSAQVGHLWCCLNRHAMPCYAIDCRCQLIASQWMRIGRQSMASLTTNSSAGEEGPSCCKCSFEELLIMRL